ncbi:MAG: hypothetical protein IKS10_00570 [Lachnospiraceae bacterium]|nr:hypothetical protein [Lachnospiraceae bacterium]
MRYETLYDDFLRLFPGDEPLFRGLEKKSDAERSDGMHVMFGMVVCPYILKIVSEDPQKTKKAFDFIEQMETSGDDDIVNVAEVTVLEDLMTDEKGGIKRFGPYLGVESRKTVEQLSQFFDIA